MDDRKYVVYKHTSPSGKVYIGITSVPTHKRWRDGNGYKGCPLFWKAIKKYGWENIKHEILLEGLTEIAAKSAEVALIAKYKANNARYGYNITKGGDGITGYKQSPEHIRKRVEKVTPQLKGRCWTEERRKRAKGREGYWTGKQRDEETKLKISQALKGRSLAPFSEETKARMREAAAKRPPEHYEKIAAHYRKPVAQCDKTTKAVLAVYNSAREAERITGVRYQDISNCICGRQKSAHGYIWKLVGRDEDCTMLQE